MVKYTIPLNANISIFTTAFKKAIEELFDFVSVSIDTTNQTKLTVTNINTSEVLFFLYVVQTTYNDRATLLIKTYGQNITPTDFINEDMTSCGPQILYKKQNTLYGRCGFITATAQKFIIDDMTVCLDESNKTTHFIGFSCNEYNEPLFLISPTNLGNIGFIGITTLNSNNVGIRTLTYDNKTTIEHNLKNLQIQNSSITGMTNMFIPESANGEYFPYVYLITSIEDTALTQIQYDYKIYLPCINHHLAVLIYEE